MTTTATPSKTPPVDTTYLDCSWSIHKLGHLYVRLSPSVAAGLGLKKQVHLKRLGRVLQVSFTKKFHQGDAKNRDVLKLQIDSTVEGDSQDVDVDPISWFAVQENRFCDFSQDKTAQKGKFFGEKWSTCKPAMNAYQDAQGANKLGSKGNWLRNVIKTDLTETQEPTDSSSSSAAALVPESFAFTVQGSAKKKTGKPNTKQTMSQQLFGEDTEDSQDEEEDESSDFASQRFQEKQTSAHFEVACLC